MRIAAQTLKDPAFTAGIVQGMTLAEGCTDGCWTSWDFLAVAFTEPVANLNAYESFRYRCGVFHGLTMSKNFLDSEETQTHEISAIMDRLLETLNATS